MTIGQNALEKKIVRAFPSGCFFANAIPQLLQFTDLLSFFTWQNKHGTCSSDIIIPKNLVK
ncbi:hypothetical protein [Colwellia sp. Arc7-635]|uniref:hypothetical protein n=1 Tax=Colwellia sp. Arc7-635 TaxID=2497879 RepID=UPI0013E0D314|nr:hypothetical protein [Colwellia sp. Arc7-635]